MEFKYPIYCKSMVSGLIIKFTNMTIGEVVDRGASNYCIGDKLEHLIPHTELCWQDVTDQYKTTIPPLELCGTPKPLNNKYKRKVPSLDIDVYDVLKAYKVVNPATQHAIKKLLCAGERGYKDKLQDLKEALKSIERAIELESDNVEA